MERNKRLGVAVVGSGRIGTLRANMVSRHPSLEFLAISDKEKERAETLGESVAANLVTDDNYEIISHPKVDTVIVSTPEHDHTESIIQALELGKPVFVEKPLALTLEDANKIVETVEKTGVELRVGYSRRHDRRWMVAREQVDKGRLGEIIAINARVYNSRAQMEQILIRSPHATMVMDALTYYVDMVCWFKPGVKPVEVVARANGKVFRKMGYESEDVTWAIITFEDGTVVNLGICYALPAKYPTHGQSARFEVLGTDGVILLDTDNKDSLLYTDNGVPHAYVPGHQSCLVLMQTNCSGDWSMGDFWGPIANETRTWLDHLATGHPCQHTTAQEGRQTVELTMAIDLSAKTGEKVKIPMV